jgi:hypothetical protein
MSMPSPVEAPADEWMSANKKNTNDDAYNPTHFPLLAHRDMPGAALGSLYDSANVIALRLLSLSSPSAYLYEERIQRHVQSILSAKEFIATVPGPASGRGSLMLGFPLKVIGIWNTSIQEDIHPMPDTRGRVHYDEVMGSSPRRTELFAHVASCLLDRRTAMPNMM